MFKRDTDAMKSETLVIVLSTVFGSIGLVLVALAVFWVLRSRRKHRMFNRGLTPIGDDEIATWKGNRSHDKEMEAETYRSHAHKDSAASSRIQYQRGGAYRPSTDAALATPRSFLQQSFSLDLPRAPEPAVFARAPNARSGLTDETVPGDEPFVQQLKRQPSRLQKYAPASPKNLSRANSRTSTRTRTTRSHSQPDDWQSSPNSSPTGSRETNSRSGHARLYSSSAIPPKITSDDKELLAGLSAPPHRRHDVIGQAIG
ncbi:hypothetical protein F4808DRAFT_74628 [Astrocystis sublimbata]|nr:hypothetical protein F4808DRAFT_74628 [Astrocystis sublimbata]